jgi:fibronectin type 3 domain-containing protein
MRIKILVILALLCLAAVPAGALDTLKTAASGCPRGIVVNLGRRPAGRLSPGNRLASYTIERRGADDEAWLPLAEVTAPADYDEFAKRLKEAKGKLPPVLTAIDIPAKKLWDKISSSGTVDSIKFWAGVLPVRLALGTAYFDAEAKQGVACRYRVSTRSPAGVVTPSFVSLPVTWPGTAKLSTLRSEGATSDGKSIRITWSCGPGKRPVHFEVRRRNLDGDFQRVEAQVVISNPFNTLVAVMRDTAVAPLTLYQYVLIPLDYYGNPGAPSDTVLAGCYDFKAIPLPQKLTVVSRGDGLRLSWQGIPAGPIKCYRIQRSTSFEKNFETIGTAAASESTYVDRALRPGVKYYYRLVMVGLRDEASAPSATVFGVWQNEEVPLPPVISDCRSIPGGVQFKLRSLEEQTVGFRVYRGRGYGAKLSLISGLVPVRGEATVFVDTSAGLSGAIDYAYAARAENAAGKLSGFSDTVTARPLVNNAPPAPAQLGASVSGGTVLLHWSDVQSQHPTLRGYRIYRAEKKTVSNTSKKPVGKKVMPFSGQAGELLFRSVRDSLLPPFSNHWADTPARVGAVYVYAVVAVDAFGDTSSLVRTAEIVIPKVLPAPAAGFRAERVSKGVKLSWDEVLGGGITGFRIYRAEGRGQPKLLATLPADALSYIDDAVQKKNLYFYWISSLAEAGEGDRSREISIRP